MPKAVITGITGQDGSYLAELLLSKGYEVHGLIRRSSTFNTLRINHVFQDPHLEQVRLHLHYGDLSDAGVLADLIYSLEPDEIYNLGAQSHVRVSFDTPAYTGDVTGLGTVRLLEALRKSGVKSRFYQASSSEMFGDSPSPQSEKSYFSPLSPYAAAKLYSYHMVRQYRDGYGMFVSNGISFNHESPRRGETFVTRKITRAIAQIKAGLQDQLFLGNLESMRDWGFAPEYVEAMWSILQHDSAGDFVIGTGETMSVKQFLQGAFEYADLDWRDYVKFDARYSRPLDVPLLLADPSKSQALLGWHAETDGQHLIKIMVDADLDAIHLEFPGRGKSWVYRNGEPWFAWTASGIPITTGGSRQ